MAIKSKVSLDFFYIFCLEKNFYQKKSKKNLLLYFAFFLFILQPTILMAKTEVVTRTKTLHTEKIAIDVSYPYLNQDTIDKDITGWIQQLIDTFIADYGKNTTGIPYELSVGYTTTSPSDKAISVIWNVVSYTGCEHGSLDIIVFNYDLKTGQLLELSDIFLDLDKALKCMATVSYKFFSETLGIVFDESLVRKGTAPELDNYSAVALIPSGIKIFFQPYQVAPWSAGPQQVDINIEKLLNTKLLKALWN